MKEAPAVTSDRGFHEPSVTLRVFLAPDLDIPEATVFTEKRLRKMGHDESLMKRPRERVAVNPESVVALIDQFLDWVCKNLAEDTYRWYKDRLQLFAKRYPDLLLSDLKRFHVRQWIDSYDVAPGTKRNFARSIVRCLQLVR